MAELGELDVYLAILNVFQFSDYKNNPGTIKSLFYQFVKFREATDEKFLLWRSIIHLLDAQDASLCASNSNDTKTDSRYKRCGTTFQGHVEKKFPKGYERDLSEPGKMATAKFNEQLNKVKDELSAMRRGCTCWSRMRFQLN